MARVFHIGQRKTGSTWLQRGARDAALAGKIHSEHGELLKWSRSVAWNAATDADYAAMAELLPGDGSRPAFASCETLIMYDPARMAAAVARRWPDAEILVTTRAPQDYLLSSFGNDSTVGFEDAAAYARRLTRKHMRRSHDLDRVAAGYGAVFGADRVRFLPYEMLRDDRDGYADRIEALVGGDLRSFLSETKVNASPPAAFLIMQRRINALVGEEAPHLLESRDWTSFMRLSRMAAEEAKGAEAEFSRFVQQSPRASDAFPKVDPEAGAALAALMTTLKDRPLYAPYLGRYGLIEEPVGA